MIQKSIVKTSGAKASEGSEIKYQTYNEWQETFLPDVAERRSFDEISNDSVELAHKLAKRTFDRTFGRDISS